MSSEKNFDVLGLQGLQQPDMSLDYVSNKKQFQLHDLVTEQRHPKTWNLSQVASVDSLRALEMLFSVDEDISAKMLEIAEKQMSCIHQAVGSMVRAIRHRKKIYFYGCGATGRLSKQMESSFWRPFWSKLGQLMPKTFDGVIDLCIGEMTGGDKALISSLEGLEDLELVGKCQLNDHGIRKGDFVMCVTEGGETSSVIGAILEARRQYGDAAAAEARKNLFFLFNNPEECLRPLDRSRRVLDDDGITKIPLCTGEQAITGSTRMQATTSEAYLVGIMMEQAIYEYLKQAKVSSKVLRTLGFQDASLSHRILCFPSLQTSCARTAPSLSKLTEMEADAYYKGGRSVYWAENAILTVFTDSTERAPTFRLFPLDKINAKKRQSLIRVVTPMTEQPAAWQYILQRPFKGMDRGAYDQQFKAGIEDPYIKAVALASLEEAGNDQASLYDFSRGNIDPEDNDIGLVSLLSTDLVRPVHRDFFASFGKRSGVFLITAEPDAPQLESLGAGVTVILASELFLHDPLLVRQHIGLKMLLNAHSTCVMAKLGKIVGNTMTNVNPSNLKLIGRSTALIVMHVSSQHVT